MQITRQADYAVRAVLHLSRLGSAQRASTSSVAEEQHIPPSFLAKIISRGARGGVTLAREPKDISLLEVVEAIDGPIVLNECAGDTSACTFDHDCPLRPVWCEAQEDLVKRLKGTNFQQLMSQS
jgi:Rrf2 family protein